MISVHDAGPRVGERPTATRWWTRDRIRTRARWPRGFGCGLLVIDETSAEVVQRIFAEYLDGGDVLEPLFQPQFPAPR